MKFRNLIKNKIFLVLIIFSNQGLIITSDTDSDSSVASKGLIQHWFSPKRGCLIKDEDLDLETAQRLSNLPNFFSQKQRDLIVKDIPEILTYPGQSDRDFADAVVYGCLLQAKSKLSILVSDLSFGNYKKRTIGTGSGQKTELRRAKHGFFGNDYQPFFIACNYGEDGELTDKVFYPKDEGIGFSDVVYDQSQVANFLMHKATQIESITKPLEKSLKGSSRHLLPCGHAYHKSCLSKLAAFGCCAVCRASLPELKKAKDYKSLYSRHYSEGEECSAYCGEVIKPKKNRMDLVTDGLSAPASGGACVPLSTDRELASSSKTRDYRQGSRTDTSRRIRRRLRHESSDSESLS